MRHEVSRIYPHFEYLTSKLTIKDSEAIMARHKNGGGGGMTKFQNFQILLILSSAENPSESNINVNFVMGS